METDKTTETETTTENSGGEGTESKAETIAVAKADYEKLNQTLGSLKRELKDLKKPKETETPKNPSENEALLQRLEKVALRSSGITHQDDIELARTTAKKWGMNVEEVLLDDDFKVKLEKQQSGRANIEATSGVKGNTQGGQAKNTPEYWAAKGVPPTPADIPDRKTRMNIINALIKSASSGGKQFYND